MREVLSGLDLFSGIGELTLALSPWVFGQNRRSRMTNPSRVVVWFSAGAASAVAGRLALDAYRGHLPVVFAYCNTGAEHSDNARFIADCEKWYGQPILQLKSERYEDIWQVFEKTRYLSGVRGARCTVEMKKRVRQDFERPFEDIQVFGFDSSERHRLERFKSQNPEVMIEAPLIEGGIGKAACFSVLKSAGIDLPVMYRLGYRNNNCIGCVKGQSGYWNKIRRDFPEVFERMSVLEQEIGAAICKTERGGVRTPVYLKDLDPDAGRYQPIEDMSCGLLCDSDLGESFKRLSGLGKLLVSE
jgi:3'-phosphoadenosine 5'-phosphosulfate sulfotransferase (PAPS reductase)/FAD synthetase